MFIYLFIFLFLLLLLPAFGSIALTILLQCFKNDHKIPKVIQYFPHAVLFIKESKSYTQT